MAPVRPYKLEACVISLSQAIAAFQNGADRIEICERLETDGMTPSIKLVNEVVKTISIPVRIMIRETEAGYACDDIILEKMRSSVLQFKKLPIEGFVVGLIKNGKLDRAAMQELIELCSPLAITVHKALDHSADLEGDIAWLNGFDNVDTILTSGGATIAIDGAQQILLMKSLFKGNIMGAGKIVPEVLPALHDTLNLPWYHGRAIL